MAKKIVIGNLSDYTYQRILKKKEADGFKDKNWKEWLVSLASPNLFMSEVESVRKATGQNLRKLWGENIGFNLAYIRRKDMKTLRDIPSSALPTIVVGGGPSIA